MACLGVGELDHSFLDSMPIAAWKAALDGSVWLGLRWEGVEDVVKPI